MCIPASVEDSSCLKDYWFCCISELKSKYGHDGLGTSPLLKWGNEGCTL